jgi:hypothetical protein
MPSTLRQIVGLGTVSFVLGWQIVGCNTSKPAPPAVVGQPGQATSHSGGEGGRGSAPHQVVTDAPKPLSEQELSAGWIALFDGRTLFGWQPQSKANWRVEDGAIVVDGGEPGLLCTTTQFSDFVLQLDFRSAKGTNSGVFLRTPLNPADPQRDCYELNIADADNPYPTGSLVKRAKAEGGLNTQDWQTVEVTLMADHVTIQMGGRKVVDYRDLAPLQRARGHIGLQLNQGRVEFRNVKLRPLGMAEVFNGKTLAGWKTFPSQPGQFTVTEEGWLHVKNGPGQLETETTYGDFVLQLECITHAPQLNSGIFFRCIPGEQMMGYESQIHNGFKNGDRASPVDCGTGGIFRRQNARVVVPDDGKWFHKTIVAHGPHMAVWVNGYQVSDWTDDRPPDKNPRKGKRNEPGTIMIQAHDGTTDLSFRNLRIAVLAGRSGYWE